VHVLIKVYFSRCSHNGQGMLSPRLTPPTPKQGISVSRRRYFRRSTCCCSVRNPFCNAARGPPGRLEAWTRYPQRQACPGAAPNPVVSLGALLLQCDIDRKWPPGLHGITMWSRVFCKARTRGFVAVGLVHSTHFGRGCTWSHFLNCKIA